MKKKKRLIKIKEDFVLWFYEGIITLWIMFSCYFFIDSVFYYSPPNIGMMFYHGSFVALSLIQLVHLSYVLGIKEGRNEP